jgi:hypothetical protein
MKNKRVFIAFILCQMEIMNITLCVCVRVCVCVFSVYSCTHEIS